MEKRAVVSKSMGNSNSGIRPPYSVCVVVVGIMPAIVGFPVVCAESWPNWYCCVKKLFEPAASEVEPS